MIVTMGMVTNFKFLAPFESLNLNKEYTVVGDNMLSEYASMDINVLSSVYSPYGLTQQDLDNDIASGQTLVTLHNDDERIYIPSNYVQINDNDKITYRYSRRALILDIGGVPVEESLDTFKAELNSISRGILGISPNIREVKTTTNTFISDADHTVANANRVIVKNSNMNSRARVTELEIELQQKLDIIESLECIIKTLNMP